jgi:hypothetical protein
MGRKEDKEVVKPGDFNREGSMIRMDKMIRKDAIIGR